MTELSATIRLRPTRIGFLVRPTDMASICKIMRCCSCLWGGVYNPTIPVFRVPPKEWKLERLERIKGLEIARGYIRFFEPDVFVEAEEGLLEEVGLGALRADHGLSREAVTLKEFLSPRDHRDWSEPAFGLNIVDVLSEVYRAEQRFQHREQRRSVLVKADKKSGLVEALFGSYPRRSDTNYVEQAYKDVFAPQEVAATPMTWLEVFKKGAQTPLRVTRHALESQRYWYHDEVIFIFDPKRPTDLIDLWNLRLEPRPVIAVPVDWVESLADELRKVVKDVYRPVRGNPNGVMHHPTVEFARSLSKTKAQAVAETLKKDLPAGAFAVKLWRNRVWYEHHDEGMHRDRRLEVTAEERRTQLPVKEGGELTAAFDALAPEFASRYGGHDFRWVNAVQVTTFERPERIGTVIPFNTFDREWPRLHFAGERVIIGTEGWVFGQRWKNSSQNMSLLSKEDVVIGSLRLRGIEAVLSEPGHIAKEMLEHLGGLWGVFLLADVETVQLLNKMAGGMRRLTNQTETVEETFERRSAPVKEWVDHLARRKQRNHSPRLELAEFTGRKVIRLGLETNCPHCQAANWHSLTAVDYCVTCERCLKPYEFPQAHLRNQNRNWHYRVVGPFSVPDYAKGSCGVLLALRVLGKLGPSHDAMTFSTALALEFDGMKAEADFVAWVRKERHDSQRPPDLIIGEAKSLGKGDLIKQKDLTKLKAIGRKLPGAVIVISVMRGTFTESEKKLLIPFVRWARRLSKEGRPTNPVILMTGNELFARLYVNTAWKELGEPHKSFADYKHTSTLHNFANATQQIYLGLPSFVEWREAHWKKRSARRKKAA